MWKFKKSMNNAFYRDSIPTMTRPDKRGIRTDLKRDVV